MKNDRIYKLITASLCLGLCLLLPFLTGQIPEIGNMLCPMHIPVFLCGFICGPVYAGAVGAVAPLLRSLLFGMPPLYPTAIAMCFELLAYGVIAGLLYRLLSKKLYDIYITLIASMIGGRFIWGAIYALLCGINDISFGFSLFIAQAYVNALPGIILHIILIPPLVMAVDKIKGGVA